MKYSFLSETSHWLIIKKTAENIKKSDKPVLKSLKQGSKLLLKQTKRDLKLATNPKLAKDFIKDKPIKGPLLVATGTAGAVIPIPGSAVLAIPYIKALKSYMKETNKQLKK